MMTQLFGNSLSLRRQRAVRRGTLRELSRQSRFRCPMSGATISTSWPRCPVSLRAMCRTLRWSPPSLSRPKQGGFRPAASGTQVDEEAGRCPAADQRLPLHGYRAGPTSIRSNACRVPSCMSWSRPSTVLPMPTRTPRSTSARSGCAEHAQFGQLLEALKKPIAVPSVSSTCT